MVFSVPQAIQRAVLREITSIHLHQNHENGLGSRSVFHLRKRNSPRGGTWAMRE